MMKKLPLPATEKWKEGVWDIEPFEKEGVSLIFFAPKNKDYQTAHDKDEFYFIIRGTGKLVIDGSAFAFSPGDCFYVPAGIHHNFSEFTDDFATWAVFF
jgi:mannose-6-phosphate isomerase-like protein (cupin superfamily)